MLMSINMTICHIMSLIINVFLYNVYIFTHSNSNEHQTLYYIIIYIYIHICRVDFLFFYINIKSITLT